MDKFDSFYVFENYIMTTHVNIIGVYFTFLDWRSHIDYIAKCNRDLFYILDWRLFVDNTGRWLTWYIFRSFSCYWRNIKWSNIYCPLWSNNWMDISSYKVNYHGYTEIAVSWNSLYILWFNNRISYDIN